MSWTTPKTNWTATDFVNVADYNRWKNNLDYLQDLCKQMYTLVESNMGSDQTTDDVPYEDMLNNIEDTLEAINTASYNFDIGTKEVFSANSYYMDYNEINRIESAELKLYNWLTAEYDAIPRLPFTLGNYGGIEV